MTQNSDPKLTRAESSRRNGAQSNGPRTEAGKQRSSINRTTHGMRSTRIVLQNESQETYDQLAALFFDLFNPRDIFEHECVANIVNSRWRIRRLEAADTANLNLAMEESRPTFEKKYENLDTTHEHALAYRAIAQTVGATDIMGRHEDRQHRIFERSYRLICKHRGKSGLLPPPEALRDAEDSLPPDNLADANPLKTQPDSQNEAFEPETPPPPSPPLRVVPEEPETDGQEDDKEPRNPNVLYEDDYIKHKPLFDAIDNHPELCAAFLKAMEEDRNRK